MFVHVTTVGKPTLTYVPFGRRCGQSHPFEVILLRQGMVLVSVSQTWASRKVMRTNAGMAEVPLSVGTGIHT